MFFDENKIVVLWIWLRILKFDEFYSLSIDADSALYFSLFFRQNNLVGFEIRENKTWISLLDPVNSF